MARPAAEGWPAPWPDLRALLAPAPERAEFAFRLALICVLTTLVVETFETPSPALSAYIVFFLNKPDRTSSVLLDVVLTIVITLVIGLVLLLAKVVIDQPAWRVAAMALFSFGMLFLTSASKLRPVGGPVALIVAYALDLLGNVPAGELATRGLLYSWLFIAIPAGVSLVTNLAIAPSPRRLAEKGLARRLGIAAAMLRGADAAAADAFRRALATGNGDILARLHLAGIERTSPAEDIRALVQSAHSTTELLFLVDAIVADGTTPPEWREAAAGILDDMAAVLAKGGYPVDIQPPMGPESLSSNSLPGAFGRTVSRFADTSEAAPAGHGQGKAGFFLPNAFSDPAHVHYALKTTGAAMFCYILYQLLDWPGIHTCLITCYIVSLGTAAETIEKLSLRILGCLAGAAAGVAAIVWVVPELDTIGGLLAIVFLGALASGWVAAGSARISYAGFQIAFAFFLCVVQGSGPAFDLAVARDRVVGVLLGNLVIYLTSTRVWPVSISRRLDPALAAVLRQLGGLARAAPRARPALLPAIQSATSAMRDDLALACYEPRPIRPTSGWLAKRGAAAGAAAALEGPLLLGGEAPFLQSASERLERIAEGLGQERSPAHAQEQAKRGAYQPSSPLEAAVDRRLAALEQALA